MDVLTIFGMFLVGYGAVCLLCNLKKFHVPMAEIALGTAIWLIQQQDSDVKITIQLAVVKVGLMLVVFGLFLYFSLQTLLLFYKYKIVPRYSPAELGNIRAAFGVFLYGVICIEWICFSLVMIGYLSAHLLLTPVCLLLLPMGFYCEAHVESDPSS
jgi:hypothetical protein